MPHYDAILFDVDGTLIDSAPGILNTLEMVFRDMGVDLTNVNLRRYIGPPLRKSFAEHFSDPAKIEEATERYRMIYHEKGSHEGGVYPGVPEMLRRLKDAGFTLCTATCKPTEVVTPILEEQGIAALQGKRVLMVGDRSDDLQGAANCGLDAAGVLYGYGSREELEPFHPKLLVESCKELTDKLLGTAEF